MSQVRKVRQKATEKEVGQERREKSGEMAAKVSKIDLIIESSPLIVIETPRRSRH